MRTRVGFVAAWLAVVLGLGVRDVRASTAAEIAAPVAETSSLDVDMTPRATIGYRKGRRMTLHVVTIGWAEVEVATAKAFLAMRAAAARDGVELWIRNGFRAQEHQEWLYQAYRAGWGNQAARPGYSNHQSGRALDLSVRDPATMSWLDTHGRRFGFKRTVRSEPWHWEFDRALARRMARLEKIAKARAAKLARRARR